MLMQNFGGQTKSIMVFLKVAYTSKPMVSANHASSNWPQIANVKVWRTQNCSINLIFTINVWFEFVSREATSVNIQEMVERITELEVTHHKKKHNCETR